MTIIISSSIPKCLSRELTLLSSDSPMSSQTANSKTLVKNTHAQFFQEFWLFHNRWTYQCILPVFWSFAFVIKMPHFRGLLGWKSCSVPWPECCDQMGSIHRTTRLGYVCFSVCVLYLNKVFFNHSLKSKYLSINIVRHTEEKNWNGELALTKREHLRLELGREWSTRAPPSELGVRSEVTRVSPPGTVLRPPHLPTLNQL